MPPRTKAAGWENQIDAAPRSPNTATRRGVNLQDGRIAEHGTRAAADLDCVKTDIGNLHIAHRQIGTGCSRYDRVIEKPLITQARAIDPNAEGDVVASIDRLTQRLGHDFRQRLQFLQQRGLRDYRRWLRCRTQGWGGRG